MSEADSTSYRCECMSSQAVSSIFESARAGDVRWWASSPHRRTHHMLARSALPATLAWRERQCSDWLEVAI
jgi:hypothetical protein